MKNFPVSRQKFKTRHRFHQRPVTAASIATSGWLVSLLSEFHPAPTRRSRSNPARGWLSKLSWLIALFCLVTIVSTLLVILFKTKPLTFSDISMFFRDYL